MTNYNLNDLHLRLEIMKKVQASNVFTPKFLGVNNDIEYLSECIIELDDKINNYIDMLAYCVKNESSINKNKLSDIKYICTSVLTKSGHLAYDKHQILSLILEKIGE